MCDDLEKMRKRLSFENHLTYDLEKHTKIFVSKKYLHKVFTPKAVSLSFLPTVKFMLGDLAMTFDLLTYDRESGTKISISKKYLHNVFTPKAVSPIVSCLY